VDTAAGDHGRNEADLVRRAQSGDAAAFGALVAHYQDRVFNTCLRLCHNRDDALDLTQTTFLRALEALPRFDARSRFFTWLFRIAVNATLSHRRQQRRRPTVSLDASDGDGPSQSAGVADEGPEVTRRLARTELHACVEAALARLDEDFRMPVVLKDVEDLDYATIAEILEVPLGTVKSRIFRSRMLLREMLKTEYPHFEAV
jgi:RNA polymerase sigma-70 factor (ECF subfamily)